MSEFTRNVIEKIKRDGIEPDPGWKFAAKRSLLWIGIALAVGIGSLSLSMAAFSLFAIDRNPFTLAPERLFSFAFFRSLPFLWIGLAGTFFALVVFEFRNTRHGYRHRIALVAVVSGIIIAAGAYFLSAWGADEQTERMFQDRFPAYAKMAEKREILWSRPEDGFLSGTITGIASEAVSLTDRGGKRWEILIGRKTIVRPLVQLEEGSEVKIIGKKRADHLFEAEDIRPWERPGNRMPKERRMDLKKRGENFSDGIRFKE
jgi:hypothetical protein